MVLLRALLLAGMLGLGAALTAHADVYRPGDVESAANDFGYDLDEVAVNQGVVAYWYAHGFANAFCCWPQNWAEVESRGLVLRGFYSPHTGQQINFDDGSLDFDGDMTFGMRNNDVLIQVQTTNGVVDVPGVLAGQAKCGQYGGKCNAPQTCSYKWCDITICGFDCWDICSPDGAVCEVQQWIMWRSFETYECRYGQRPCDDKVWMASGLAPIDAIWKERAPFMEIEYIWGKCVLKKAKVHCCQECAECKPSCNKCQPEHPCVDCQSRCPSSGSGSKCGPGNKCATGKCGR